VTAHVGKLNEVLRDCRFDSLVYLSSTRVYQGAAETVEEGPLQVSPAAAGDLVNLSKAMGESLALNCGRPVRIARLSNVYGPDFRSQNFLASVIRDALGDGVVTLQTAPESAKDYIHVGDVVDLLIRIGASGTQRMYNVASGCNVSHADLLRHVQGLTGCDVRALPAAPAVVFPTIRIDRVQQEFGFSPRGVLGDLPWLVECYRRQAA
jgi:nucleoside-diphosphate-sugar epimerase